MESLDDILKDIESWPVFEPISESNISENQHNQARDPLKRTKTCVFEIFKRAFRLGYGYLVLKVHGALMKAKIAAEKDLEPPTEEPLSAELVVDPKLEYQVGTQIYFGNDLYEVKGLTNRNHRSQCVENQSADS